MRSESVPTVWPCMLAAARHTNTECAPTPRCCYVLPPDNAVNACVDQLPYVVCIDATAAHVPIPSYGVCAYVCVRMYCHVFASLEGLRPTLSSAL